MAQQLESSGGVLLGRTLKLVSEAVAPGGSLLLEGKVGPGIAHLALGVVATAFIGPLGRLLVSADSYATSVTGRGLLSSLSENVAPAVETAKK